MGPSWVQILVVGVAVVLLLGRGKISSLMGEVAQGIKSFRKGMSEDASPLPLEADFSQNDSAKKTDRKAGEKSPAKAKKDV